MIPDNITIWTTRGYQQVGELTVGDKVISFNPNRWCMELDSISLIETDWKQLGLIGLTQSAIKFRITPDHPILLMHPRKKELQRVPIDDMFMQRTNSDALLSNKPFEPYKRTQDLEDVAWSARLAASSSRHAAPPLYSDQIHAVIQDITAEEAQHWLNTFFHWNVMRSRPNYMKTAQMRSGYIKDMILHVAPRAGVGTFFGPLKTKAYHLRWNQAFSIAKKSDVPLAREHWTNFRHEGLVYNIATTNGNFLGKMGSSTFPMACKYTKEI